MICSPLRLKRNNLVKKNHGISFHPPKKMKQFPYQKTRRQIIFQRHHYKECLETKLEIHTDQGRNFQSDLLKAVCKLFGVTQTRTTPYHPASNGQVERFNLSLLQMIRCYINRDQTVWDEQLPLLLAAYRSTSHQSTGISPNFMMLGREVHQMTDLVFKDSETLRKTLDHATYIKKLKSALDTAHSVARKSLSKCQQKQKRLHDVRLFDNQYEIGDLVYVNKMAKRVGKCPKLEHVWEGPFVVVKKYGPVLYEV